MLSLVARAVGLALALALILVLFRRRHAQPHVLPALRALPAPLPWERAFWRRAPKDGGFRE
jgi:hypothetical protein